MPPSHSPGCWVAASLPAGEMISGAGLHVLKLAMFDAYTNTGAQTTVSKSFDAISQQSVKQKTFVSLHTAWKSVSKQKDADISWQEQGLFVGSAVSLLDSKTESHSSMDWVTGEGWCVFSEGQHHALILLFVPRFKMFSGMWERSGSDRLVRKHKEPRESCHLHLWSSQSHFHRTSAERNVFIHIPLLARPLVVSTPRLHPVSHPPSPELIIHSYLSCLVQT